MISKNVSKTCGNCVNYNLSYMICGFEGHVVNWHTCNRWTEFTSFDAIDIKKKLT